MTRENSRMVREKITVTAMVKIYCHDRHGNAGFCPDCQALLEFVSARLEKCPFQKNKPTCAKCTTHCYNRDMRERIKVVMRYSGPRMVYRHPILLIHHLLNGLKKPANKGRKFSTK